MERNISEKKFIIIIFSLIFVFIAVYYFMHQRTLHKLDEYDAISQNAVFPGYEATMDIEINRDDSLLVDDLESSDELIKEKNNE